MATQCNGMLPCLGSSAPRLRVTQVGHLLPSGSPSVGRQQIMWSPTIGKAAISAEVSLNHSDMAETADRKCRGLHRPLRSTEAMLLIASHDPTPTLHRQMEPVMPLDTRLSTPADRHRLRDQRMAPRRTCRLLTTLRPMEPLPPRAQTASPRPHLSGGATPRVSHFATRVVCF